MKNKSILIQCSARSNGDTSLISKYLSKKYSLDVNDLADLNINPFDYDNKNEKDDFLPTIKKLIAEYDHWIFLSPVYWYSISGRMKIFFDRITDLMKWHKDTGRLIRGKSMTFISVSNDAELESHFDTAVRLSAGYLSMKYQGHHHCQVEKSEISEKSKSLLDNFMYSIMKD